MRVEPLDPALAALALETANDREAIFRLVLSGIRSRLRHVALLTVHHDQLRGDGELQIARNSVPVFEAAIASRVPSVKRIATGESFVDGLLEPLGVTAPAVLVLPLTAGERTVALAIAYDGTAFTAADVAELMPLASAADPALERVLSIRARAATPRPERHDTRAETSGYEVEVSFVDDVATRRAALAIHRTAEAWLDLASTIRDLIRDGVDHGDPDEDEQLELLLELGHLEAAQLDRPDRAIEAWRSAQTIDAGEPRVLDALESLFAECGRWLDCVELLEKRIALTAEREPRITLLLNLAAIADEHLGDAPRAIEAYERVGTLDPANAVAVRHLTRLDRASERWQPLAELLARQAEAEPDADRRVQLHAELGELYETRLERPADALAHYERALADEPESTQFLIALHRLQLETEQWDALVQLLPRLIDALAPTAPLAVIVDLHVELGTVLADHLERPDDAVHAFQDALALDPRHVDALAGITRVCESTGLTEALLDVTEANIDAGSRVEQVQRYGDIAAAWHEFARFDRAAACWQKLLALEPRSLAGHAGLARALRDDQQWSELEHILRAHLVLVPEAEHADDRVVILRELATLLETLLDDPEGAVAINDEIVEVAPQDRVALDALARLHDRANRLQPALDALQRLLEPTTEPRARADVLERIGQVYVSARDAVNARLHLVQAIALDPANPRAREAMARVHVQQGELVAAGEEMIRAAQLGATVQDTVRCLADAAWLYRHRLGDTERARECLHRILELEPEHADAKQALAEMLGEAQEWESLWPHLMEQVQRVNDDPAAGPLDRHDVYTKAARCAVELGKFGIAMELYDSACSIAPSPETLVERAEALYRSKSIEAAAASYQTLATQHPSLPIYRRLAQILTELGRVPQAQQFHQKVLDLDPGHRETLDELVELHLARSQFDDAVATLRSLVTIAPVAERPALLERIGDLYRHRLASAPRAASTYLEVLELDANNRRVLQKLLDLHSEAGQWKAAVETIERFLDHETDRARRAAYHLAAAEIRRTELRDAPGAFECYEHALDELLAEDPLRPATRLRAIETFQTLDTHINTTRDWKYLEQAYRRMIKRMPKEDPVLMPLWHALGELCRSRLEHAQSAIQAFEVAHALDPDKSPLRGRILAELYARIGAKQPEQASEAAAKLVEVDPTNADAYRALGRTSLEAGNLDEAWCVSRALVVLEKANAEEAALYRQYQALEVRKATGILDDDSWALVRHPEEDRAIGAIFALVWESVVALRAGSLKSFELKAKERMPVETDTRVVAKIFRHASRLLNVALPDVYAQPRRPGRLLLANLIDKGRLTPVVIVGRDLMTGYRDTEIAAAVGGMLALLRPTYYLKLTLSTVEELEAALAAAAQLVGKKLGRPELEPLTSVFVPEIQKRLTRPIAEVLLSLVVRVPAEPDLARWRNAVDAAAQRAGLLVAGELAAAARMISSDATALGGLRPSQRVQELIGYSVSPSYFAVRRHLGVTVA